MYLSIDLFSHLLLNRVTPPKNSVTHQFPTMRRFAPPLLMLGLWFAMLSLTAPDALGQSFHRTHPGQQRPTNKLERDKLKQADRAAKAERKQLAQARLQAAGPKQQATAKARVALKMAGMPVHVTPTGAGAMDGSSWANAFSGAQLQQAINQAAPGGDPVWVAAGTYTPNAYAPNCTDCAGIADTRNYAFEVQDGVQILGGFPATGSPTLADRNPVTHETILSGEVGTAGDPTDNLYHVVISVNDGLTTSLDGLIIQDGYSDNTASDLTVDGEAIYAGYGAGMHIIGSSLTLQQVTFRTNYALGGYGGGLSIPESSATDPVTLINCIFSENGAEYDGGGLDVEMFVVLTDCQFMNNSAQNGGGAYLFGDNSTITNCTFEGNSAVNEGGGAYTGGDAATWSNCKFLDNISDYNGGGIYTYFSTRLENCAFVGNSADGQGGGVYQGDALIMINCLFSDNLATGNGGGVFGGNGYDLTVMNCTFNANHSNSTGGGLYCANGGTIEVINSIFWANTAGGAGMGEVQINSDGNPTVNIGYSIIQDGVPTFSGVSDNGNNSSTDPLFTNSASVAGTDGLIGTSDDGLIPQATSPAADTGDDVSYNLLNAPPFNDITARPRVYNSVIDIGAYEFELTPCSMTATITPNPGLTVCASAGGLLTASAVGETAPYTYAWSTGDTGANLTVNATGTYSVTATDTGGCSATASVDVTALPAAPLAAPTLSASSSVVCEGGLVSVTATPGGTVDMYQWYKDGVSLGAAQSSSVLTLGGVQPAQAGNYVLVVSTTGCASGTSAAFALTVNPAPTVILVFPNNANVNQAGPVIRAPVGQGLNYQVFGGGPNGYYIRKIVEARINTYLIQTVVENQNGIFPLDKAGPYTHTVTDANGCTRTVTGEIVAQ